MNNQEITKGDKNKKVAIVLAVIAFIWYLASMFTIWK